MNSIRRSKQIIGLIGGLGPAAGSYVYQRLIQRYQEKFAAKLDGDFPPVILYAISSSGLDQRGIRKSNRLFSDLREGCEKNVKLGCKILLIACNSAYYVYDRLQKTIDIPIVNMISETAKAVKSLGYKKVGIISAESANRLKIFQKYFDICGIQTVSLNSYQQNQITKIIVNLMAGKRNVGDINRLNSICRKLAEAKCEAVVIGCTELSMVSDFLSKPMPIIDSTDIAIEAILKFTN